MATQIRADRNYLYSRDSENGYGLSQYAGNSFIFICETPKKLNDFPQGIANAIFVGEVSSNFRSWGDPLNARDPRLSISSGQPNGFGGHNGKPPLIGLLDGSGRTFDLSKPTHQPGEVPE